MNLKNRFENTRGFLAKYSSFFQEEILNFYPSSLEHYPEDWITDLLSKTDSELWRIEQKKDLSSLRCKDFRNFLEEITELQNLPYKELRSEEVSFPDWAFIKVKGKKRHEIQKLATLISEFPEISQILDIGGGIGHLARTSAHYLGIPTCSIDANPYLQSLGKIRAEKYPIPDQAKSLNFQVHEVHNESYKDSLIKDFLKKANFTTGLHTCGPLANWQISMSLKNPHVGLINFGCCYAKLNPETDLNLSSYAKKDPLVLSPYALTLASRSHNEPYFQDFQIKKKVKYKRYGLHLLLYYLFNLKKFVSVGEIPIREYDGPFSDYALKKLEELNIKHALSQNEINDFFQSSFVQEKIKKMFLANIIRWPLGRILEIDILLDRCLLLEEHHFSVDLFQLFDPHQSPRNIGILAFHKGD